MADEAEFRERLRQKIQGLSIFGIVAVLMCLGIELAVLGDNGSIAEFGDNRVALQGGQHLGVWRGDADMRNLYWDESSCDGVKEKAKAMQAFSVISVVLTFALLCVYIVSMSDGNFLSSWGPSVAGGGNTAAAVCLTVQWSLGFAWYAQEQCGARFKDLNGFELEYGVPGWVFSSVVHASLAVLAVVKGTETFGPPPPEDDDADPAEKDVARVGTSSSELQPKAPHTTPILSPCPFADGIQHDNQVSGAADRCPVCNAPNHPAYPSCWKCGAVAGQPELPPAASPAGAAAAAAGAGSPRGAGGGGAGAAPYGGKAEG